MMAKSPAERKAAQRARQSAAGERKLELILDAQELDMLERNCAARRPGCAPYEMGEYISAADTPGRCSDARSHQSYQHQSVREVRRQPAGEVLPL